MFRSFFEWVDTFPTSIALRESDYGFAFLLTSHVVAIAWFAGLILMMDLRLMGWGNRGTPISQIQKRLFPWQMVAMGVSAVNGLLLVYSQPMRYYGKVFFWIKMLLMLSAGINAIWFHFTTYKSVAEWDHDPIPPYRARLAGGLGLALWAGVMIFGRLTAYNWIDYLMAGN
jgi:hypothetical protein